MYYGFDIGGTKIEFGAFNESLERVATRRVLTPTDDYSTLLTIITQIISEHDEKLQCEGKIGIGIPGIEKPTDGTLLTSNIPAAKGKTLRKDLEAILERPVLINNDANCFALSEAWDEEINKEDIVLGLILGTGFGGGLVHEGKIMSGMNNVCGELGHMRLPIDAWMTLGNNAPLFECGCGQKGCADNYLSGRGFENLYQSLHGEPKKAVDIIAAFYAGDEVTANFVDKYMEMVAQTLAGIFTALDPNVVVLGGGLSNFEYIYETLPERLSRYLLSISNPPKIMKAKHGDAGGVRGAAFLNLK